MMVSSPVLCSPLIGRPPELGGFCDARPTVVQKVLKGLTNFNSLNKARGWAPQVLACFGATVESRKTTWEKERVASPMPAIFLTFWSGFGWLNYFQIFPVHAYGSLLECFEQFESEVLGSFQRGGQPLTNQLHPIQAGSPG